MRGKGVELDPGIFAENITTRGVDLSGLPVGYAVLHRRRRAGADADRQGMPPWLRDLPGGRRLRHAAQGHIRQGNQGRMDQP